jgi:phenylacetic acid degradation operon negative regulatory protein
MKLLKKKVLFSLATESDFLQNNHNFSYHPYKYLYYRTSEFDPGSVRDAVNELVGQGAIDKITRNRQARLRLTALGHEIFLKNIARIASKQPWKGRWVIVAVNKVGSDLRPLQTQLKNLGFKRFSRGVYLSPLPVVDTTKEMIVKNNWFNRVFMIESRRLLSTDDWQLARNLWRLEKLGERYNQFITLADRLLRISRANLILLQQAKFGFKTVFDTYFKLISVDPGLPKALLPPDWKGDEARLLFYRLVELTKTAKL